MSDTPETDALLKRNRELDHDEAHDAMLELARSLERRLHQCDIEREKWKEWEEVARREVEEHKRDAQRAWNELVNMTSAEIIRIRNTGVGEDHPNVWNRQLFALCDAALFLHDAALAEKGKP